LNKLSKKSKVLNRQEAQMASMSCTCKPIFDLEMLSRIRNIERDIQDAARMLAVAQLKLKDLFAIGDPNIEHIELKGGIRLTTIEFQPIHQLLMKSEHIPAIKALRELRNISLAEAKHAIDDLKNRENYPSREWRRRTGP